MERQPDPPTSLSCARCQAELQPGGGDFYQISIEAAADPWPPFLPDKDPQTIRKEIQRLVSQLEGVSEQEAMDQVYRRLTLYLCLRCYDQWIEDPVGHGP